MTLQLVTVGLLVMMLADFIGPTFPFTKIYLVIFAWVCLALAVITFISAVIEASRKHPE